MPSIRRVKEWYAQSFEASMVTGKHCRHSYLHDAHISCPMTSDRLCLTVSHNTDHFILCSRVSLALGTSFVSSPTQPECILFHNAARAFLVRAHLRPRKESSLLASPKGLSIHFSMLSATSSHPFLSSSHLDPFRTASLTFALFHSPYRN